MVNKCQYDEVSAAYYEWKNTVLEMYDITGVSRLLNWLTDTFLKCLFISLRLSL